MTLSILSLFLAQKRSDQKALSEPRVDYTMESAFLHNEPTAPWRQEGVARKIHRFLESDLNSYPSFLHGMTLKKLAVSLSFLMCKILVTGYWENEITGPMLSACSRPSMNALVPQPQRHQTISSVCPWSPSSPFLTAAINSSPHLLPNTLGYRNPFTLPGTALFAPH